MKKPESLSPTLFSLSLLFSLLLPPAPRLELVGHLAQAVGRLAVGGLGELLGLWCFCFRREEEVERE